MTGRLTTKGNKYYIVLNMKEGDKKYKQKWMRTGLNVKGNREKAEFMLQRKIQELEMPSHLFVSDVALLEFIPEWLRVKRIEVQETTYEAYRVIVNAHILPYLKVYPLSLLSTKPSDLQNYYLEKLDNGLRANTLIKHHTVWNGVFQYAMKHGMIAENPMIKVTVPRKSEVATDFFTEDEMLLILDKIRGTPIESAVYIAVYTGFRRGEVLGSRWKQAIDWKKGLITMNHTMLQCGSKVICKDGGKSGSSVRTLVIAAPLLTYLQELYLQQKQDRALNRGEYNENGYICKRSNGTLLTPNYVSGYFKKFLEKHGLPPYHFHTLRIRQLHSCYHVAIRFWRSCCGLVISVRHLLFAILIFSPMLW